MNVGNSPALRQRTACFLCQALLGLMWMGQIVHSMPSLENVKFSFLKQDCSFDSIVNLVSCFFVKGLSGMAVKTDSFS